MKVSLNVRRETIDVQLEPEDGLSPREIQRALRNARVQFSTVSSKGQWQLPSQQIQQLPVALDQFSPLWDVRALERLSHLQEDNRLREIVDGQASRHSHRLESAASLGMKPYDEQWEAAEVNVSTRSAQVCTFLEAWFRENRSTDSLRPTNCCRGGLLKPSLLWLNGPWQCRLPGWQNWRDG